MCAQFRETIRATLNPDNDLRKAAEQAYADAKRDQPVAVAESLVLTIANTQLEQHLREQCGVLLRRALVGSRSQDSFWTALGQQPQAALRSKLLECLEAEMDRKVRRKVADCVQTLGNELFDAPLDQNETLSISFPAWPELLPTLMRFISDSIKDAAVRADSIWIVRQMIMVIWPALLTGGEQTLQIFRACFSDASDSVAAEGAALFCGFVGSIKKKSDKAPYASLVPELIVVVQRLAQQPSPDNLDMLLQEMQEPAEFFKDHISTHIMPVIGIIAKGHSHDGSRRNALEVVNSLYEAKPKAVLKVPGFLEQALDLMIHFVMELDDDTDTWMNEDYEAEPDGEEQHRCGKESIDRLSRAANSTEEGFAPVLDMLKPAVAKLFASGEWKQVLAGIVVLSQIAEYIDDEETVQKMMHGVIQQLRATHPRVRYAAWGALAQFSVDHEEAASSSDWAKTLLPEFIVGMEDPCERVAIRSMETWQHYGEQVDREDMEPFVQPMMECVGKKLQGSKIAQKRSITFIAVMARQLEDSFADYYPMVMPILQQIVQATVHQVEERSLLGKCFECMSLLAKAVGREGFRKDMELVMGWMIQTTKIPGLPSNDPVNEYMMAASERICGTMKEDFLPFVPCILPGVLAKLSITPKSLDDFEGDPSAVGTDLNFTIVREEDQVKILCMNTSDMEEVRNALDCVHTLAGELRKSFAPYISQTAQALLPVFEFSMAEEIRELAFETWGQLCASAKEGGQSQVLSELVMEFMRRVLPKLNSDEDHNAVLESRAEGIKLCIEKAGPGVLGSSEAKHISDATLRLLWELLNKHAELRKEQARLGDDDDLDEDDDSKLLGALCEISGALMQHHPDSFAAECLQDWLRVVTNLLQPGVHNADRKLGLFVVCDMLAHLGSRVTPNWSQFLPQLLADIRNSDAEVRQAACYGISWAAKSPMFAEVASQSAVQLAEVVTVARSKAKKKSERPSQACADNALSGLIEILRNHQQSLSNNEEQLWNVWVNGLPCQEDEQEAKKNHSILLQLLQQQAPQVVGADGRNVPRVLAILVDLYNTEMVDEGTSAGIAALALTLGDAALRAYSAHWPEKRQKKLLRVVRDAQKPA